VTLIDSDPTEISYFSLPLAKLDGETGASFSQQLPASPAASSKAPLKRRSPAVSPKRLPQTFKINFLAFLFQFSQTNK
jgi:hypothetical protein